MNRIIKRVIISVAAVAAAAGGVVYFMYPDSVVVDTAKKSDISMSISETGNVAADDAVTVYAPVAGKLSKVVINVNDTVKKDALLASYDTEALENQYEKATLNTEYYQDGYNAAINENNKNAAKMQEAAAALEALKQQYVSTREGMDAITEGQNNENNSIAASLAGLQANLDNTQIAMEAEKAKIENSNGEYSDAKLKELISSVQNYRNQIAALPVANMNSDEQGSYNNLVRQLELIEKEWSISLNQKSVSEEKLINEAQLQQYQDSVEIAKVEEEGALNALNNGKDGIHAVCEGTVTQKLADAGAFVEAGTPLFVIQPLSGYKVSVMISRFDIDSINIGQKADITLGNTVYEGRVGFISPIAQNDASGKPKVKVDVVFSDKSAEPTIGIQADVKIYLEEGSDLLSVATKALYTDDGGDYVYIISDGKVAKKYVVKGLTGSDRTEITEGISEGDQVIVTSLTDESVGDRVLAE